MTLVPCPGCEGIDFRRIAKALMTDPPQDVYACTGCGHEQIVSRSIVLPEVIRIMSQADFEKLQSEVDKDREFCLITSWIRMLEGGGIIRRASPPDNATPELRQLWQTAIRAVMNYEHALAKELNE